MIGKKARRELAKSSNIIKYAKDFCHHLTGKRFIKAEKKKFSRNVYLEDMLSSYVTGALAIIEVLANEHSIEKILTFNEFVGVIDILRKETNNEFAVKYSNGKMAIIELKGEL